MKPIRNLHAQGQGASSAAPRASVIQRYPVEANSKKTKISATQGRPDTKSNKSTITAIVANIYSKGPLNKYEKKLYDMI